MSEESPKALRFARIFGLEKTKKYPYLHSEIDAISKLWGKTYISSKHSLVNVRMSPKGELRQSKPCDSCSQVVESIGIKVYYFDKVGNLCSS